MTEYNEFLIDNPPNSEELDLLKKIRDKIILKPDQSILYALKRKVDVGNDNPALALWHVVAFKISDSKIEFDQVLARLMDIGAADAAISGFNHPIPI